MTYVAQGSAYSRITSLWREARIAIRDENGRPDYHACRDMLQGVADAFTSSDGRAYRVSFNPQAGVARTSQSERVIEANPAPLTDETLSADEAAAVMTAYLAHECTHDRYWRSYGKVLDAAFGTSGPLRNRAHVYDNLLQDVIGERRFESDYPGFTGIFAPVIEYVARTWPNPKPMRDERPVNIAISAVRYAPFRDWDGCETERAWWESWRDRWAQGHMTPSRMVAAIREALDHEREALDPQSQGEGSEGEGEPQDGAQAGSQGRKGDPGRESEGDGKGRATDGKDGSQGDADGGAQGKGEGDESDADAQGDGQGQGSQGESKGPEQGVDPATHGGGHGASTAKTTGSVPEDMTKAPDMLTCNTDSMDAHDGFGARADAESRSEDVTDYIPRPNRSDWPKEPLNVDGRLVAAVTAAFQRSRTGLTGYERGYRSGMLDNRALDRLAVNDGRVFGRRDTPDPGKYRVMMMLDTSGSMYGGGADYGVNGAAQVAAALAQAGRHQPNLRMGLWAWGSGPIVRVWESGDPLTLIAGTWHAGRLTGGGTRDAAALRWATKHMRSNLHSDEQGIIFMLSDGFGESTLAEAAEDARRKGITVIGVTLSNMDMTRAYGKDWVPWGGSIGNQAEPLARIISRAVNPTTGRH